MVAGSYPRVHYGVDEAGYSCSDPLASHCLESCPDVSRLGNWSCLAGKAGFGRCYPDCSHYSDDVEAHAEILAAELQIRDEHP